MLARSLILFLFFLTPAVYTIKIHNAFPLLGLCLLILFFRAAQQFGSNSTVQIEQVGEPYRTGQKTRWAIILGSWIVVGAMSLLYHEGEMVSAVYFVTVFVSGGLAYASVYGLRAELDFFRKIFVWTIIGAAIPMILGLYAYYGAFGIPDLPVILLSHFNLAKMQPYMSATFGSIGNTAGFLLLVFGPSLALLLDREASHFDKTVGLFGLTLILLNMVVIASRTGVVAAAIVLALMIINYRCKVLALFLGILLFGFLSATGAGNELIFQYFMGAATLSDEDNSVVERKQAIEIGWDMYLKNPEFGIGPSMTSLRHPYTSCHEFLVQEACELGTGGLVVSLTLVISVLAAMSWPFQKNITKDTAMRFALISGPLGYIIYAALANAALNAGSINVWTIFLFGYLSLTESSQFLSDPNIARESPKPVSEQAE